MAKNTRNLLIICIIAVAGAFALQFLWVRNYYDVNKASFEKEVNLAFEDAIKKELALRCDTIQHLIEQRLMDTSYFDLSSKYKTKNKRFVITFASKHNLKDYHSLSFNDKSFNKTLKRADTAFKRRIASKLAFDFRTEDLENHFVYYRTQTLGDFMVSQAEKYAFDTARLKPIFKQALAERNIRVPFKFYMRENDNTLNRNHFSKALLTRYPVITKSFPTYTYTNKDRFVRAMFSNPFWYIIDNMALLLAGSVLLVAVVAFSLSAVFRSLLTEKKLSGIKNDFISNMTHELKTPIASASAAIEAITDFDVLNDEEKTKKYLGYSRTELQKLSVLVDRVLHASIYEKKLSHIKPEELNPDEIIKPILLKHKQFSGKSINYTYSNDGITALIADQMYFEHAINNLIDNAVKYGGSDVQINVSVTARQGYVLISVKDNGVGISMRDQQFVFEKFYRVTAGNQHAVKGHGLGLSYVKSIIERHNGWCKLISQPGHGSTFILGWPV